MQPLPQITVTSLALKQDEAGQVEIRAEAAVQVKPEEEMAEGVAAEIYISVCTHLLSGALYQRSTKRELQRVERDVQNNPIPGHQLDQDCKYCR